MKNIEEKAEELVEKRIELSREESIAYFQGIEAGANYVLGQVEILLNSQRFVDDPSQELFELIKQLKK